ncbi:MAG: replication-associated recombination protein A [Polyangiaceae bacterium]
MNRARRPEARGQPGLFASAAIASGAPLADRMRPRSLDEVVGQKRLVAPGTAFRRALESHRVHSMVLWGPPGCGKTTLASLIARYTDAEFESLSAVLSGLPEVREAVARAEDRLMSGRRTVLFVDEVHRFNKTQQDAFLPHVERGTLVLVGATTENPSFSLNSALLSRCRVHVLEPVGEDDIVQALQRALTDPERGLGKRALSVSSESLAAIAKAADGDVRRALTLLEIAADLAVAGAIEAATLAQVLADRTRRFDRAGDAFYDQISALHKSVRSSNPDAALYWFARMMDGGVDPAYLARRLTRMAIEDIGLADPRALTLSLEAWDTYDRLGSPEGDLVFAEVVLYLALAPKSNAAYAALTAARADVEGHGSLAVPVALRNAPTKLMRDLGHGKDYVYDHDRAEGVAFEQRCFPEELGERRYYEPREAGLEIKLREKLSWLRARRGSAPSGGAPGGGGADD